MSIGIKKLEQYVPVVRDNAGLYTALPIQTTGAVTSASVSNTGSVTAGSATAATAGGSTTGLYIGSGGVGIFFGSGAPTISAAQGSLYLRTDGSSTSTRAYINSNGSTTWVAVTTAS